MPTRSQEMKDKQVRAQYTQEFKLEAVRQVRAGQAIAVVAKVLGIPKASLGNWVRLAAILAPSFFFLGAERAGFWSRHSLRQRAGFQPAAHAWRGVRAALPGPGRAHELLWCDARIRRQ